MPEKNFAQDAAFIQQHVDTIVLENDENAKLLLVPAFQGRTMTSTSLGDEGTSYGYVNYDAIKAGNADPQINLYGGEDRMWISPEGGQYSIFFPPNAEMEYANWRTPKSLDTEPFNVVSTDKTSAAFEQESSFINWSGFEFQTRMRREVKLLDKAAASQHLDIALDDLSVVAHESHNTLTNTGDAAWEQETGLIGIWMLCMNKPSPGATLVVPFKPGPTDELGQIVNADYFGKLDDSRLQVDEQNNLIFFRGDGNLRSKLGLTFQRVQPVLGSWDKERGVLSVVQFNLPAKAPNGYNNNLWKLQDNPYDGDVINCYNDGPNESGGKLGGFFELETISPALALAPGDCFTHIHRTLRMEGDREKLSEIAQHVFGVSLDDIEEKLGK